jgi:hypothetical protein
MPSRTIPACERDRFQPIEAFFDAELFQYHQRGVAFRRALA